jgi:hypothetical protein
MTAAPRGTEPEIDDSQNPTTAAPVSSTADSESAVAPEYAGDSTYASGTDSSATSMPAGPSGEDAPSSWSRRRARGVQFGGAERLGQVQTILEEVAHQARPVARQAAPVLREIAAKAAELAAIAAEHAGPLAKRAAEVTQDVGVRVAARSREVASDLRRSEQGSTSESTGTASGGGAEPGDSSTSSRSREGTQRPPATPGL